MMFYACDKNGRTLYHWHLGEEKPVNVSHVNIREVEEIQADGEELIEVLEKFSNIPRTTNRVQRWFGDLAKFIVSNL
jgi:hypothetical protein